MRIWISNLSRDLFGPYGYRTWIVCVTTIVAAYFSIYAVLESRHDRQLNRALFERNTFMTMVSSGNAGMFVAAIKDFGPIQKISVPIAPTLFMPWKWAEQEFPNEEPLLRWAKHRFPLCTARECGFVDNSGNDVFLIDLVGADLQNANLEEVFLVNSRLTNARLDGSNLRGAYLIGALLESATARGVDLRNADLTSAVLNGTDLMDSDLREADLLRVTFRTPDRTTQQGEIKITLHGSPAHLQGANLTDVKNASAAELNKAYWNEKTIWPKWHTPPCKRNVPDNLCDATQ